MSTRPAKQPVVPWNAFWVILVLVPLPLLALHHLFGPPGVSIGLGWSALMSIFAFTVYWYDKRQAKQDGQREPEAHLHWLEVLGGWPGAYLAQRWLRHKSTKASYQFVFWLIVILYQLVAVDALRDWAVLKLMRG